MLPYTNPAAYCFFLVSVAFSFSGLLIGSLASLIIHKCTAEWFRKVRYPSVLGCPGDRRCTVYYHLSSPVFHIEEADRYAEQVMMGSRFRIWITMLLLSAPLAALTVATTSAGVGECLRKGLTTFSDAGTELGCFKRSDRRCLLFAYQVHPDWLLFPCRSASGVRDFICFDDFCGRGLF